VTNSGGRLTSKHVAADARRLAVASSANIYNFMHTTGGTVLAVSQANDTAAVKSIVRNNSSATNAGFQLSRASDERLITTAGRILVGGVPTAGSSITVTHNNTAKTTNAILIAQYDPDNATAANRVLLWQDGEAETTTLNAAADEPAIENASGDLTIGAGAAAAFPHDGTIGDVGIWSVFFSEAERKLVEADQGRFNSITVAP
jgi:hypothetical protein